MFITFLVITGGAVLVEFGLLTFTYFKKTNQDGSETDEMIRA